ncbi:MAG: hypothetical protein ACRDLL_01930 [Solirubrobacterales bacterium]
MTVASGGPNDRLGKLFVDRGDVSDLLAADERLRKTPLQLVCGSGIGQSETQQITASAIVAMGVRAFPAGVHFVTDVGSEGALVNWACAQTLGEVLSGEGAEAADYSPDLPSVFLGRSPTEPRSTRLAALAVPRGWAGGVVPVGWAPIPEYRPGILGAVVAAAMAVSEIFHAFHDLDPRAARRAAGFSLWRPDSAWTSPDALGPRLELLPYELWLLGLGHLGQALAWLLRALPWGSPSQALMYLQDFDTVEIENIGTSLLSRDCDRGRLKTRRVAEALEEVGLRTRLVERRFDGHQRRQLNEPASAIVGLDKPETRRPLDSVGWSHLIDAGIGAGAETFTQFVVHRLGGERSSEEIFAIGHRDERERLITNVEGYRAAELDQCGTLTMAGQAVGTSFVGGITAAVSLAELIRPLHEGPSLEIVSGDLTRPKPLEVSIRELEPGRMPTHAEARDLREIH